MGIIFVLLIAASQGGSAFSTPVEVPTEVVLACHTAMGIGSAAAAAAVVSRQGGETKKQKPAVAPQGKGYQLTEHVRRYYETTKV